MVIMQNPLKQSVFSRVINFVKTHLALMNLEVI